jgi:hypothetical protein
MEVYPALVLNFIYRLPGTPRWLIFNGCQNDAHDGLIDICDIYDEENAEKKFSDLIETQKMEIKQCN